MKIDDVMARVYSGAWTDAVSRKAWKRLRCTAAGQTGQTGAPAPSHVTSACSSSTGAVQIPREWQQQISLYSCCLAANLSVFRCFSELYMYMYMYERILLVVFFRWCAMLHSLRIGFRPAHGGRDCDGEKEKFQLCNKQVRARHKQPNAYRTITITE